MQAAVHSYHKRLKFSASNNVLSLNTPVLSGFIPLAEKYTLNVPPKVEDLVCFYLAIIVLISISIY